MLEMENEGKSGANVQVSLRHHPYTVRVPHGSRQPLHI